MHLIVLKIAIMEHITCIFKFPPAYSVLRFKRDYFQHFMWYQINIHFNDISLFFELSSKNIHYVHSIIIFLQITRSKCPYNDYVSFIPTYSWFWIQTAILFQLQSSYSRRLYLESLANRGNWKIYTYDSLCSLQYLL